MSQDQICSLLEIITEILNSSQIDIRQFVLDAKYIDTLASNLAGNDSSNETDRLSRVLANVFHLFSDTLYRMPEFNKAMTDIIRNHDRALKEHKEVLDDHEKRIQRMEYDPHDVEEFLESLPSLRLSKKTDRLHMTTSSYKISGEEMYKLKNCVHLRKTIIVVFSSAQSPVLPELERANWFFILAEYINKKKTG